MPQSFLLVALAWNNVKLLLGDGQEEREEKLIASVKTDLAEGEEKFREAGLEHEIIYYGSEEDMARLESKLAEREWTGVCIGFGIRGTPLFTTFFERLVNTIHEKSPKSKLLFNNGPSGTFEAVRRWFP